MTPQAKAALERWRHRHRSAPWQLAELRELTMARGSAAARISVLTRQVPKLAADLYRRAHEIRAAVARHHRQHKAMRHAFGVGARASSEPSKALRLAMRVSWAASVYLDATRRAGVRAVAIKALDGAVYALNDARERLASARRVKAQMTAAIYTLTRVRC